VAAAYFVDGGGGGRVASHDQGLDVVLRAQVGSDRMRALGDEARVALAVGRVAAVGEIDEALVRQLGAQRAQHAEAADAAVEDANGARGKRHGQWPHGVGAPAICVREISPARRECL
jgi:hypothetical protein